MRFRIAAVALLVIASISSLASRPGAYPGGTPRFVTNAAPYCAGCHSSVNAQQLREMPADAAAGMLPENRHYKSISGGEDRYQKLEPADRQKLLDAVKAMDANCKVELAASDTKVKPSGTFTVTVTTRGGAGPVVGVMLTDNDLRFQSGPVQCQGFLITKAPEDYITIVSGLGGQHLPDLQGGLDAPGAGASGRVHDLGRVPLRDREGLAARARPDSGRTRRAGGRGRGGVGPHPVREAGEDRGGLRGMAAPS